MSQPSRSDYVVWGGVALGLLVTVALYLWAPWPTFENLLVDGVAFVATFVIGAALMSQFVLPVQTWHDRWAVVRHFFGYSFGAYGPIVFVKQGKQIASKKELAAFGQGVALIDPSSAIVLERAATAIDWFSSLMPGGYPLVRAAGPGVCFIDYGERIVATLDLRPQSRSTEARALTHDGIEVRANVAVTFSLNPSDPGMPDPYVPPGERNRPAYAFNPRSAFKAVYGKALGEKQSVEWTDLAVSIAVECFRNLLAESNIDELFQPTVNNLYPFAHFQGRVQAAVQEHPALRERGTIVTAVRVSRFTLPREVINQRVLSWQARWQKASIQQRAAVETQTYKTLMRKRREAQQQIVNDMIRLLGESDNDSEKNALALTLTTALQRAAGDPATRQLLPRNTLRTLTAMSQWLNPMAPSDSSILFNDLRSDDEPSQPLTP